MKKNEVKNSSYYSFNVEILEMMCSGLYYKVLVT